MVLISTVFLPFLISTRDLTLYIPCSWAVFIFSQITFLYYILVKKYFSHINELQNPGIVSEPT